MATTNEAAPNRLLSIDALRGFDMFWIMGGEDLATALAVCLGWSFKDQVKTQFQHAPWDGFRFYDLIFPLFLFIVGVVLPFSLGKIRDAGESKKSSYWRILRRTLLLLAFGLIYNNMDGTLTLRDFGELRTVGVLQRIALAYCFAGIIVLNARWLGQFLIASFLLIGYWALLTYIPSPEPAPADYFPRKVEAKYSMQGSLPGYIDRHYLPSKLNPSYYGLEEEAYGDNEGLLSTLPAIATALLGALAGAWLRSTVSSWWKVLGLISAGGVSLAGGYYWDQFFPIIKNLWTSSFVLVAGGWSLLLLALFYMVIDVLKFRLWSFFFVVIGSNAIFIYMAPRFIEFKRIAHFFLDGLLGVMNKEPGRVLFLVGELAIEWLLLLFLFRRRLFLRV